MIWLHLAFRMLVLKYPMASRDRRWDGSQKHKSSQNPHSTSCTSNRANKTGASRKISRHRNVKSTKKKPLIFKGFQEAQTGFEPVNRGVADLCLTTWLLRRSAVRKISLTGQLHLCIITNTLLCVKRSAPILKFFLCSPWNVTPQSIWRFSCPFYSGCF